MLSILKNLKTRVNRNKDTINVRNDIRKMREKNEVIIETDKTGNYYCMKPEDYSKRVRDCITEKYRKADMSLVEAIDLEARTIPQALNMDKRVHRMGRHKADFPGKLSFRLINPCKSEVGRISQQILTRIVGEVRIKTGLGQCTSTKQAIDWFNKLENKHTLKSTDKLYLTP